MEKSNQRPLRSSGEGTTVMLKIKKKSGLTRRGARPRLEGDVTDAPSNNKCHYHAHCSNSAVHKASMNVGLIYLCQDCLAKAKEAAQKNPTAVADREKAESKSRSLEYKKNKLTLSGGGANGTGKRSK
jgi:hypothetical protein